MKSIAILIDYFGAWPKWFPVFLASCGYNDTVNWIIRTDCDIPANTPPNVKFIRMSYQDYIKNVSEKLNINFNPISKYKICDLKPVYGDLYQDDIAGYDYYGFGDLDIIFGDIRKFYTDEVLSFDVISTHEHILSGHFALFKNEERLRKAYTKIPRYAEYLENPYTTRFDEDVYSCLFVQPGHAESAGIAPNLAQDLQDVGPLPGLKVYFKEQYTTVFHPMAWHDGLEDHPEVWHWKDGMVTNERNIGRDYLYLHLMNFQSMRWTNSRCREINTAWKDNPDVRFTLPGEEAHGITIDWTGIQAVGAR